MSVPADIDESLIGHYAGAVTRLTAFVVDTFLSIGLFNIGVAAILWIVGLFTRIDFTKSPSSPWWLVPLAGWLFLYFWYCYSTAGKTPGKALLGLRVVRGDGSDVDRRHAAIRVVIVPARLDPVRARVRRHRVRPAPPRAVRRDRGHRRRVRLRRPRRAAAVPRTAAGAYSWVNRTFRGASHHHAGEARDAGRCR